MNVKSPIYLTPAHLNKTQQDLLVAISGNSAAFRVPNGWRARGEPKRYQLRTGDELISKRLVMEVPGRPTTKLQATNAGEALALEIKRNRQSAAGRKRDRAPAGQAANQRKTS